MDTHTKTIAFDIDGTWTLAPNQFRAAAGIFRLAGWNVIIVTGSAQPYDKLGYLMLIDFPIIYSGGKLKRVAAEEAGYNVDVWVDNEPGTIEPCRILQEGNDP